MRSVLILAAFMVAITTPFAAGAFVSAPSSYVDWHDSQGRWLTMVMTNGQVPHIAYSRLEVGSNNNFEVRYRFWNETSWQMAQVQTHLQFDPYPAIAVSATGKRHIVYMSRSGAVQGIVYQSSLDGVNWSAPERVANPPQAPAGHETHPVAIAIGSDGEPQVAYFDEVGGKVHRIVHQGIHWVNDIVVGNCSQGYPSLQLGPVNNHRVTCLSAAGANSEVHYAWLDGQGVTHEEVALAAGPASWRRPSFYLDADVPG